MEIKLIKCPFKGCESSVMHGNTLSTQGLVIHKCDVVKSTMVCTPEQWNSRSESPAVKGMLEALKAIVYTYHHKCIKREPGRAVVDPLEVMGMLNQILEASKAIAAWEREGL